MAETSASAVRDKLNHVRTQVKFWLSASQRDWSDFISADLLDRAHALGPEAYARVFDLRCLAVMFLSEEAARWAAEQAAYKYVAAPSAQAYNHAVIEMLQIGLGLPAEVLEVDVPYEQLLDLCAQMELLSDVEDVETGVDWFWPLRDLTVIGLIRTQGIEAARNHLGITVAAPYLGVPAEMAEGKSLDEILDAAVRTWLVDQAAERKLLNGPRSEVFHKPGTEDGAGKTPGPEGVN